MKRNENEALIGSHAQSNVSCTTYLLVCAFGVGSWVAFKGLCIELPNLVNETPEGWKLASYIPIICQMANVGPIVYGTVKKRINRKQVQLQRYTIYGLFAVGCLSCVFLAIFWRKTVFIFNKERSVVLIAFIFLVALVDCTTSVTFLPFMSILPGAYVSPYYVGEHLSGLIPSFITLVQGVGSVVKKNATAFNSSTGIIKNEIGGMRFGQDTYFVILGALMLLSLFAFILLNYLPSVKIHHVHENINMVPGKYCSMQDSTHDSNVNEQNINEDSFSSSDAVLVHNDCYSRKTLILLLIIFTWLNILQNGIVTSISSFACGPYGAAQYHLGVTIGSIISTFVCFIFLWFPWKSLKAIFIGTCAYNILATYLVIVATQSPNPWLHDKSSGKILIVVVFVVAAACAVYTKLAITSVMRDHGHKYLFYTGAANQLGSFIGAVIMFPIVNYAAVFKSPHHGH